MPEAPQAIADRNLLFGVLALQSDLIDHQQFVQACTLWSLRKEAPLAEILIEHGWLTTEEKGHVDFLLERKLKRHSGDAQASLATLADHQVVQALSKVENPAVQRTLLGLSQQQRAGHVLVETLAYQPGSRERYKLTRLHAKGGIGQVWLARDDDLGREVALKELLPERADHPDVWARFQEEARITGQLEHPGIVPVYELVKGSADQKPFYTMRFIRGRTLSAAIADYHQKRAAGQARPMDLRGLLGSFVAVCNAIAYAHSRRVLHRDLKPQNIVLGDFGEVIVLDWGLAKLMDRIGEQTSHLPVAGDPTGSRDQTVQGQVLGTPGYMPPEQAEGRLDMIEQRSDVYGLGAILYDILVNQAPFRGEDTQGVLRRVVHELPVRPREIVKDTPLALEAVCLKALAKKPADRYGSPGELAEEIQCWMADEPVSAWREPAFVRAGRWVRRHRTSVATAVAAGGVAVLGLLAVAIVQAESRRRLAEKNQELVEANSQIAESRDRAERRVDLAVGAIDNFRSAVDDNLDVKNRPENQGLRKTLLQAPLAFYQKLGADLQAGADSGPEDQTRLADSYYKLATLNREIGSQTDALKEYGEAVAILDALVPVAPEALRAGLNEKLATFLAEQGALQSVSSGMNEASMASYQRALALLEARLHDEPQNIEHRTSLARILANVASSQSMAGKVDPALASLDQALTVLVEARRLEPDNVNVAVLLARVQRQRGSVLNSHRGQLPEALASVQKALTIAEPVARAHPDHMQCQLVLSEIYAALADVRENMGEVAASVDDRRRQLTVLESMIKTHPTVTQYQLNRVRALRDLAATERDLGQAAKSLATLKNAEAIVEALIRDNPSNTQFKEALSDVLTSLAATQYGMGQVAEALASVEASAALVERISQSDPGNVRWLRDLAGGHYNIALLNKELGRVKPALASYRKALDLRERLTRQYPADPRFPFDVATTLGNIGAVQREEGQLAEARASFQQATEILAKLAKEYPKRADYLNYLARAQQNLGATLKALGQLEQALELQRTSIAICETMVSQQPKVLLYQDDLAAGLAGLGETLLAAKKPSEAIAACEKGIAVRETMIKADPTNPHYQIRFAVLLKEFGTAQLASKGVGQAIATYRRAMAVLEKLPAPSAEQFYNLAGCHSLLAAAAQQQGSGMSAANGQAEAEKAIELLRQALSAGYRNAAEMRTDSELDSLRKREDFQKLLQELDNKKKTGT